MSTVSRPPPIIRPAKPEDIPQVHAIYSHYVVHTATDMHHAVPSLTSFAAEYESLTSLGLPYLVAVAVAIAVAPPGHNPTQCAQEASDARLEQQQQQQTQHTECILGFIHAFPFRGYKVGYSHTAELAIICHPEATKYGVGSALMRSFLDTLEVGGKIEQILAFMTVLEDEGEDERVKGFYEKWGFREAGRMNDVGQKFGRRFSKRWMQRSVVMRE